MNSYELATEIVDQLNTDPSFGGQLLSDPDEALQRTGLEARIAALEESNAIDPQKAAGRRVTKNWRCLNNSKAKSCSW